MERGPATLARSRALSCAHMKEHWPDLYERALRHRGMARRPRSSGALRFAVTAASCDALRTLLPRISTPSERNAIHLHCANGLAPARSTTNRKRADVSVRCRASGRRIRYRRRKVPNNRADSPAGRPIRCPRICRLLRGFCPTSARVRGRYPTHPCPRSRVAARPVGPNLPLDRLHFSARSRAVYQSHRAVHYLLFGLGG